MYFYSGSSVYLVTSFFFSHTVWQMGSLSSLTKDGPCAPWWKRMFLTEWTAVESPLVYLKYVAEDIFSNAF